jgi:hypothetical protein
MVIHSLPSGSVWNSELWAMQNPARHELMQRLKVLKPQPVVDGEYEIGKRKKSEGYFS